MHAKVMTLVLATHNPGKLAELRTLLPGLPVEGIPVRAAVPSYAPPV